MKVFILAGGKGTRLGNLTNTIPKPLIKINSRPVLEYQIRLLRKYGLTDITILINHLGEKIKRYFGNGKKWGVNISYFNEVAPLGTAGGIKDLEKKLKGDFLVLYGDLLVNIDLKRLLKQHVKNKRAKKNCIGTLVVHPNDHPYDSDLVEVDKNNVIIRFLPKPHPRNLIYRNLVNAAVHILSSKVCKYIKQGIASDFGKDIFPFILTKNRHALFAYNTPEYLKDMGTFQRLKAVTRDVRSGKYEKNTLDVKKPAIFLDRDGVINEEVDQLHRLEDFRLLKNASKAIKKINQSNFYAVVITNQPMIAKGLCTYNDVLEINKKMETELGNAGVKLDSIYFCPHHPDKGFHGENKKYKIKCRCRKPDIALVSQAVKALNIDITKSFFIGDSTTDAMTAKNAGVAFAGVSTGYGCKDNKFKTKPLITKKDLMSAIKYILYK